MIAIRMGTQTANPGRVYRPGGSLEAEDIVDSLVGHMAGRRQPDEFPTPGDWRLLVGLIHEYHKAEPWIHWSDIDQFDLVVKIDGVAARYLAVVLGQDGIQRGLALYPGEAGPDELRDWQMADPTPMPDGTLLCYLDSPDETPHERLMGRNQVQATHRFA
jgi:hypothetical protein